MTTSFYVDSHCHLDLVADIQRQVVYEDSQPIKTITVTNAPSFYNPNIDLFGTAKNIRVGVGLHPELAVQFGNQLADFHQLIHSSKYIGEIGLDGSTRFKESFHIQQNVFESILAALSKTERKILTIHSRNAAKETINLLKQYLPETDSRAILHWYTGDKASLQEAVRIGCYFSFNHKMLQTPKGIDILKFVPLNRLLTETDAPFTFDAMIKSRLQSLEYTLKIMGSTLGKDLVAMRTLVYENFRELLV